MYSQEKKLAAMGIVIGENVWIWMNAIILKRVEIDECAIISAGSVVKTSVPTLAVVEGNPAKFVNSRSR